MNRTIFFMVFFLSYLSIMQFSLSQEDNIKITIRRFAPSLSLSIPQGSSNRLNFYIENTYNETLIIFYRIEQPSGVEIDSYPPKYYSLTPNTEMAGNFNITVDPYLENRSYIIRFWIDSFTELENKTIQSDKFSINLTVLSNPSISTTTTTTTAVVTTTAGEVPIITETTLYTTEIPTINPPTDENHGSVSFKEFFMILGVVVLFLILPLIMLRKLLPKSTTPTSSREEAQASPQ